MSVATTRGIYFCLVRIFTAGVSRKARAIERRSNTIRSEEHTSELQSQSNLVCRLLLEKKKNKFRHSMHPLAHLERSVTNYTSTAALQYRQILLVRASTPSAADNRLSAHIAIHT